MPKAIVTRRGGGAATELALAEEGETIARHGLTKEEQLPQGALVSGETANFAELEKQGFRIKLLPDTDLLKIGSYVINTAAAEPPVPPALQVPQELSNKWRHHLVQLSGPPTQEWIRTIEGQGVMVVGPISVYGLFVVGEPTLIQALTQLRFVTWVGPFKPAYRIHDNLKGCEGKIRYVSIGVYPPADVEDVKQVIQETVGATIVREAPPTAGYQVGYATLIVEMYARSISKFARLPSVRWLEYVADTPGLDGEREVQIVAENFNSLLNPELVPAPGYQAWLANLGLSGTGVTIAICDTGIDLNEDNNVNGHLDLRGRQVAFINYASNGAGLLDTNGHGTHVAGIAVGNAGTGRRESADTTDFLWGQGVAPQAGYITQNALVMPNWPPSDMGMLTRDAVANGAQVMNNSWHDRGGTGIGYSANARRFDELVRDPNPGTPALDQMVIVFSAGNSGPGAKTITSPKEAKNVITVGNSCTYRPGVVNDWNDPDNVRGLAKTSSRGPALDGRILPTVVAPGTDVSSARSSGCPDNPAPNTVCDREPIANTEENYVFATGTSMATPHVAGACALLIEWWRNRSGGALPSPALLKAMLINGAEDLAGGPDGNGGALAPIPNSDQGWGRISLPNMLLDAPLSDRGPKLFVDQSVELTSNGQEHLSIVIPVDSARPLRITLVWTDAPGAPNDNPALVNDLDLEVLEVNTNTIFKGNVFQDGFSVTGGSFDNLNNVECVYLAQPNGTYEVRVIGSNLTKQARPPFDTTPWQDYALVIDNAVLVP